MTKICLILKSAKKARALKKQKKRKKPKKSQNLPKLTSIATKISILNLHQSLTTSNMKRWSFKSGLVPLLWSALQQQFYQRALGTTNLVYYPLYRLESEEKTEFEWVSGWEFIQELPQEPIDLNQNSELNYLNNMKNKSDGVKVLR